MGRSRDSYRLRYQCPNHFISMPQKTYAKPVDDVGVSRVAGATSELLVAGRSDGDGVLHCSQTAGVKRAHVEDIDALHLSEDFETLQTGGLLEVGRDGAGSGARAEKVVLGLDLCCTIGGR
jgi:hypothetical protein